LSSALYHYMINFINHKYILFSSLSFKAWRLPILGWNKVLNWTVSLHCLKNTRTSAILLMKCIFKYDSPIAIALSARKPTTPVFLPHTLYLGYCTWHWMLIVASLAVLRHYCHQTFLNTLRSWKSSLSFTTLTMTINVISWAISVFRMESHNYIRNRRA